jgi:hypothetical protein
MIVITKKALPRRTFLRGLSAAVALPLLDSMTPAFAAPGRTTVPRMAFLYTPNGIIMKDWTPTAEGAGFEFTKTLQPLAAFRGKLLVLTGLEQHNGESLGDGAGDHARAGASWLTGAHPKKTEGADIHNGTSVDQMVAQELGRETPLPSLELGLEDVRMVGNCDSGYSCAYSNTISWSSPTKPLPYETNPRGVFERLFGDGETTDAAVRAMRAREDRSILDFVRADTARITADLGAGDRRKMSDYLDSVREIERRIQWAEEQNAKNPELPPLDRPDGIPPTFEEHIQLMYDMMTLAFQADLTRVITFMYSREGGNRTYPQVGVPDAHHGLSHHMNDPAKMARLQKIDQHHVQMLSYFLGKMQAAQDGDGTLLDHSMIVYGGSLSDSNQHLHYNLPALLIGGKFRGGQHIRYPKGTPMTNLFLSMLDVAGVRPEKIGDGSGKLDYLSGL